MKPEFPVPIMIGLLDPALKDQIKSSTDSVGTEFLIYNEWLPPTDDVRIRKG